MLKSAGSPYITILIIKFQANRLIVTALFSSPLLTNNNQAKQDACNTACAYIVRNRISKLEQLGNMTSQWNDGPKEEQSEDKDSNSTDDIPDLNEISRILEGEPSTVNNDIPSNIDEEVSDEYFPGLEEEGTHISAYKNEDQLEGPSRKIPRTTKLFLEQVWLWYSQNC